MKVKVKILKSFHQYEEGTEHSFDKSIYQKLLVKGYVKKVTPKKTKK